MWIFAGSGLMYVIYQVVTAIAAGAVPAARHPGVWPMAPLLPVRQEAASRPRTTAPEARLHLHDFFGAMSFLTGLVLYKPAQFWWLTWMLGGFHLARIWHFAAMCGFVAFIPAISSWCCCTAGTTSTP